MDSTDDSHFRHYSLKHRAISWLSRNAFDRCTYTSGHGLTHGLKRKGGLGWLPASFVGPQSAEEKFWRTMDLSGATIYDVGAFEGLLTMFFAQTAKQVVSYEPNVRNLSRLNCNLGLNQIENVTVRPVGVGEKSTELKMVWDPAMPGGASVEPATVNNLRRTVANSKLQTVPITTLDLDRAQRNLPSPDLIKIDIEGWELQALRGAIRTISDHKPMLYLEMHGETLREKKRKVAEIVDLLQELGDARILHVESGESITADNSTVAIEGHLHCVYGNNDRVRAKKYSQMAATAGSGAGR